MRGLGRVAGWEPYDLHDLVLHAKGVGSVLHVFSQILDNISQRQL